MKALVWVQKVRTGAGESFMLEGSFWGSLLFLGAAEEGEDPALGPEGPKVF